MKTALLQKIYINARKKKVIYKPIRKHFNIHLFG